MQFIPLALAFVGAVAAGEVEERVAISALSSLPDLSDKVSKKNSFKAIVDRAEDLHKSAKLFERLGRLERARQCREKACEVVAPLGASYILREQERLKWHEWVASRSSTERAAVRKAMESRQIAERLCLEGKSSEALAAIDEALSHFAKAGNRYDVVFAKLLRERCDYRFLLTNEYLSFDQDLVGAKEIFEREVGPDGTQSVIVSMRLAYLADIRNDYETASARYEELCRTLGQSVLPQPPDEIVHFLVDYGDMLSAIGELDQAEQLLNQAQRLRTVAGVEGTVAELRLLTALLSLDMRRRQLDSAKVYAHQTSALLSKKTKLTGRLSFLLTVCRLSQTVATAHDPATAERILALVNDQCRSWFADDHFVIGAILHAEGEIAISRGNFNDASDSLEKAVKINDAWYGRFHPRSRDLLRSYSFVLRKIARGAEADEFDRRILAIDQRLESVRSAIASRHQRSRDDAISLEVVEQLVTNLLEPKMPSIALKESSVPSMPLPRARWDQPKNVDAVPVLDSQIAAWRTEFEKAEQQLGDHYRRRYFVQARELLVQISQLAEKLGGFYPQAVQHAIEQHDWMTSRSPDEQADLIRAWQRLSRSNAAYLKGRLRDAREEASVGLEEFVRAGSAHSLSYAGLLKRQCDFADLDPGHFEAIEKQLHSVQTIVSVIYGAESDRYLEVVRAKGKAAAKQNHYEAAWASYHEALSGWSKLERRYQNRCVTDCLIDAAELNSEIGELDEAERILRHSIDLNRDNPSGNVEAILCAMAAMSRVEAKRDHLQLADFLATRANSVLKRELDGRLQVVCPPWYADIIQVFVELGQLNEAEELLDRVQPKIEALYGRGHYHYAGILHVRANWFLEKGDRHQAEECLKRAIKINDAWFESTHPRTLEPLQRYALVLKQLDRGDELAKVEERIQKTTNHIDGIRISLAAIHDRK